MADNVKTLIAAGFERLDFHILDSTGIAAGTTGTVSQGAAGSAAGRMLGVQTAEIKVGEPDNVNIPGDDGNLGTFEFGPAEIPSFDIIVGVMDLTWEAVFQGTTVFNEGSFSWGVLDPNNPSYADVAFIGVSRAKSKESGTDGVSHYQHVLIPKANVIPLGRDTYQGRTGAGFRYRVQPTRTDSYPWGLTLKDAVQGTPGGVIFPFTAPNRTTFHRFTGDNGTASFTVAENFATASTNECRVYINTTLTTGGVTPTAGAKTLAIAPAPGTNAKIVVYYQYTL